MTRLEKSVDVGVPAHRAFEQLTRYEEYPRFMEGVREVQPLDATHLHWRCVENGAQREWDSEITAQVPDQLLAWRNISDHQNIGQVRLQPLADDQTRLSLSMEYEPQCPADQVGEKEALTAQRIEGDLQRFKQLVETGTLATAAPEYPMAEATAPDDPVARPSAAEAWLPTLMKVWEEPLSLMRRMSQEMDGVFGRILARPMGMTNWTASGKRSWAPPVEVARRADHLVISADLPGITREQVNVEIKKDKLTIEGDWQAQQDNVEYRRTERNYGHFYRAIPLPEGIDPEGATASMHDGVLEVTLPLLQQESRRRLDIDAPR